MKRYIDKFRGRQGKSLSSQKEDAPGEASTGREAIIREHCLGCDRPVESTAKVNEEISKASPEVQKDPKMKTFKRVPTVKQQIEDVPKYWGTTTDIGEAQLAILLQHVIQTDYEPHFKLARRLNGSFNVAYIMESVRGWRICVRVPACGFPGRWNDRDADLLRATALGMKYIYENTELPIPQVLAYSADTKNEINAPYTIMTFLEGKSVTDLWDDLSVTPSVLEARRQKIMHDLANIMRSLATTTFARAGTLWFPDDDSPPEVGNSYRLDKAKIFALKREFLEFPPRDSVAELLRCGQHKRLIEDRNPGVEHDVATVGVYALWDVMIEAFLQSGGKQKAGEPEFVLMQSDFNRQNILADETGKVTGLIDWDCLESIPRCIGWCSLPHWLEVDWCPDYRWPPEVDFEETPKPDEFDRYRADYAKYMREVCQGRSDSVFTSRSHIYQVLFDSVESFAAVECFVYNVLTDILPRSVSYFHTRVDDIGRGGFQVGEREWFEARLVRYFAPDAEMAAVE
ncbi:uncharacterized protein RCC_04456 [Ramularia collo-cygni]|uniref:Aminoglycoside phosphotransferase domain-containing protein n=1 Tax=Ramularia collo-cygni TaxID=112498 RepID=A0A2D3UPR8_9PEZI|nr:uncharacterized protein RCC_04456 [Ramularia collo-cygni]CZT18612.1 uncharacterized protein RCC_04456 [Ramularia collo-cygni]